MAELLTFLILVTVSLLVVRVGAAALQKTGLSREAALFQSQSAFMGVGFTTSEAETVVSHPVRRRIIRLLMLLGFGAVTSALGTVVVTFARADTDSGMAPSTKLFLLVGGLAVLWGGARLRPVDRLLERVIGSALERATSLRVIDFAELLDLDKGYAVATLPVATGAWVADRSLRQLNLADEGILVLSITRASGLVIATPASSTKIEVGDRVLVYGLEEDVTDLTERCAGVDGDDRHKAAVERQRARLAVERVEDLSSNATDASGG